MPLQTVKAKALTWNATALILHQFTSEATEIV